MLFRMFLLPFPHFWYWGFLWALLISLPAAYLARKKNRTIIGWTILCSITSLSSEFSDLAGSSFWQHEKG